MDSTCYQIEVLHLLNPHLMWVEVLHPDATEVSDYALEQIGLYGIMPLENTIDIIEECLKTRKGLDWAPGVVQIMSQVLQEAKEVWFSPVHVDNRSSIFDNNIHKYGEIIIETKTGALKKLSKILTKTSFAYYDDKTFLIELMSFNLKTLLNKYTTQGVITVLEKCLAKKYPSEKSTNKVKKHTTAFHKAQEFENALTAENLKLFNRKNKVTVNTNQVKDIIQHKQKDFDLCKGIDEVPVGRGVSRKKNETSSIISKKLSLAKEKFAKNDTLKVLEETREKLLEKAYEDKDMSVWKDSEENCGKYALSPFPRGILERRITPPKKSNNSKKSTIKPPDYDEVRERRIAYGPPSFDQSKLSFKVVPKNYGVHEQSLETTTDDAEVCFSSTPIKYTKYLNKSNDYVSHCKAVNDLDCDLTSNTAVECNKSINNSKTVEKVESNVTEKKESPNKSNVLMKKFRLYKLSKLNDNNQYVDTSSDTSQKDTSSDDNQVKKSDKIDNSDSDDETTLSCAIERLNLNKNYIEPPVTTSPKTFYNIEKTHVNPFKNLDPTVSKFVEKLVSPVLMVHTKENKRIQPVYNLRDINFNSEIHSVLANMSIKHPMTLQTVSWSSILRGYSLFMISPQNSGKTLGYIPAVCRLVADFHPSEIPNSVGPICIIVCATTKSVLEVEKLCCRFLGKTKTVLSCYAGLNEQKFVMSLLNGCDVLVSTPMSLVRLMNVVDFGVDLKRLTTFVIDDCERLNEIYLNEVRYFIIKIKDMLKNRLNKELRVQYVLSSRIWCEFMEPLAKRAPNTVVSIGAFQECVFYSKAQMSIRFVKDGMKPKAVIDFLYSIDSSKKTVVVCRTDDDVNSLKDTIPKDKFKLFVANNKMTIEDLYTLSNYWSEYEEPVLGPLLLCCDSNLTHLNITNVHYLLHYSLPNLFSMFTKRFSVLTDNYPSIFQNDNKTVKIKILLEEENVEQLPKIIHFIKRCSSEVPEPLNVICDKVLAEKDLTKAKRFIPYCDNTMALGECPDFWNCPERHTFFKEFDLPKTWMPTMGYVTFKMLHYHTAISYSVRLTSNIVNGKANKYPETYKTLPFKMGRYYSKESNRQPHGIPVPGDFCAVSIKQNFFVRCQVVNILSNYPNGNPNYVLVKLIDEEKWERTRDIHLFYLPDEFKDVTSYVALVKLAGIQPKDKDVTFSDIAKNQLRNITEKNEELFMRAKIVMTIGNTILINNLEACQDLTSVGEIVVRYNFNQELLKHHAIPNPDHISKIEKLCKRDDLNIETAKEIISEVKIKAKSKLEPRWAHLANDDFQLIYFASAKNPENFFIRLEKFEDCLYLLSKDIQKYISDNQPEPVNRIIRDDIVLAKFPDDSMYYRARIDEMLENDRALCFFVDHGDWREVPKKYITEIPEKFIAKIPFQAIECKLIGLNPSGRKWTEFSTNWFCDQCFMGNSNDLKELYVKYFTKEIAKYTGGNKYGIVLIDTTTEKDIVVNLSMLEHNLAQENEEEIEYLDELNFKRKETVDSDSDYDISIDTKDITKQVALKKSTETPSLDSMFLKKPIRSMSLISSDESEKEWDVQMDATQLKNIFKIVQNPQENIVSNVVHKRVPAISQNDNENSIHQESADSPVDSDFEIINSPKVILLDSDDLSSPDEKINVSSSDSNVSQEIIRKPKLYWRQNKEIVFVKIELSVENYTMDISNRSLEFSTLLHDVKYGFKIDLYGGVDVKKSSHAYKGLYILVKLYKLVLKNWLSLTKDNSQKKWIVCDPDSIDASSDEDDDYLVKKQEAKHIIEAAHYEESDDDNDDEDAIDDLNFKHKYFRNSDDE